MHGAGAVETLASVIHARHHNCNEEAGTCKRDIAYTAYRIRDFLITYGERIRSDALEAAALVADRHWPESGHTHQEGAVSCQMSISVEIRRMKSDPLGHRKELNGVEERIRLEARRDEAKWWHLEVGADSMPSCCKRIAEHERSLAALSSSTETAPCGCTVTKGWRCPFHGEP